MMKKGYSLTLFALLASGLWALGCGASGRYITEQRSAPAFDAIEISGAIELDIAVGPEVSISVEGDDDVVRRLQTDVRDKKLWIHSEVPYLSQANLKVKVTAPEFAYLGVSNSGNIIATMSGEPIEKLDIRVAGMGKLDLRGVQAENLSVTVRGAGNVAIAGQTENLDFDMNGAGAARLEGLCAKNAKVKLAGTGKITVNPQEHLDATLKGLGAIHYYGDPQIQEHLSRTAKLKRIGDQPSEALRCGT